MVSFLELLQYTRMLCVLVRHLVQEVNGLLHLACHLGFYVIHSRAECSDVLTHFL